MRFRPCIDIHNGSVKQIVGGSLKDDLDQAKENFVSLQDASFYAAMYKNYHIYGGHVILLNSHNSDYYEQTKAQALNALRTYPGGLQIGGGITEKNAGEYFDAGASHVIVTSYVFENGLIHYENLKKLVNKVGKERLVLDLSCRKQNSDYYIVTDRWQKFTKTKLSYETLDVLASYCSEFLIHAVDLEGKSSGIETELAALLGRWGKIPVTYAGGIGSYQDLKDLRNIGQNKLDATVGSALDLFGGNLEFRAVLELCDN